MSKKSHSPKKHPLYHLVRYILSFVAVVILVTLIYPFVAPQHKIVCANSISCITDLKAKVENNAVGIFDNEKVIPPKIVLSQNDTHPAVLGASTSTGTKHIYVDLSKQMLYAYQGKTLFMSTRISSGKWNPTPTGDFHIWIKLRSTRMTGGEGQDYYDLPNVEYVMYFYNQDIPKSDGFALHGAYWHDNFGHPMSHGCINMRNIDAQKLYDWANPTTSGLTTYATTEDPGTEVTIYGEAPL